MADYFTHFSCLLDVGTSENALAAHRMFIQARLEDVDRDEPLCSGFELSLQEGDAAHVVWIHDDVSGDVEQVIGFVQRLAETFDLKGMWGFAYALCRIRHKAYYAEIRIMPHGQCPRLRALALAMRSFGIFRATRGRPAADRLVGIG
jgi:hypothetical protein